MRHGRLRRSNELTTALKTAVRAEDATKRIQDAYILSTIVINDKKLSFTMCSSLSSMRRHGQSRQSMDSKEAGERSRSGLIKKICLTRILRADPAGESGTEFVLPDDAITYCETYDRKVLRRK